MADKRKAEAVETLERGADGVAPPPPKSFLNSRGSKIFLGVLIFMIVFTMGYGLWRLSGGSFKPKSTCPDTAAEARLKSAASASPDNLTAQLDYGNYLYGQCKNFSGAVDTLQKATTLADKPAVATAQKASAHLSLGLAYFYNNNNQLREAQSEFQKVLSLEPENKLGLYMLASTLRKDDPKQAVELFRKVAILDPNGSLGKDAQKSVEELAK